MKKLMLFFTFIVTSSVFSQEITINRKKIPEELYLLVDCLWNKSNKDEKFDLIPLISGLNANLHYMTPPIMHFLIKSEIYKFILEENFFDKKLDQYARVTPNEFKNLQPKLQANYPELCAFNNWVYQAISSDMQQIIASGAIEKLYAYQGPITDKGVVHLKKVSKYITPWLTAIKNIPVERVQQLTMPKLKDLLTHLIGVTYLYEFYSMKKYDGDQNFFQLPAMKPSKTEEAYKKASDIVKEMKPQNDQSSQLEKLFKEVPPENSNGKKEEIPTQKPWIPQD